jgi:hypothetical protein
VIAGSRVGDRLGSQVAISSRPIVVSARPGEGREAVSNWVREAPRVIERGSGSDSGRLAPILARERALPASAVEAMRERAVVADRGRLTGPAAGDVAPRGVAVERARPVFDGHGRRDTSASPSLAPAVPSQGLESSRGLARPEIARPAAGDNWRFRGRSTEGAPPSLPPAAANAPNVPGAPGTAAPDAGPGRSISRPSSEGWRYRGRPAESLPPASVAPAAPAAPGAPAQVAPPRADWRSRSGVPPARRVIDGAVPYRRPMEATDAPSANDVYRARPASPSAREYRSVRPERREAAPPPPPRVERAPESAPAAREAVPPPQPSHRSAPPPPPSHERGRYH